MKKLFLLLALMPILAFSQITKVSDYVDLKKSTEYIWANDFKVQPIQQPVVKSNIKLINTSIYSGNVTLVNKLPTPRVNNSRTSTNLQVEIIPIPSYNVYRYNIRY